MQYFNIQLASQLSGVASATIRAWEKRYNAVIPARGDNKHRLYSETDIEKLALLSKLTELGQTIGKIAPLELIELKEIYARLMKKPYEEKLIVSPSHDNIDTEKMLAGFFLALSAFTAPFVILSSTWSPIVDNSFFQGTNSDA
jgi:DNA-binding transcriptional MerR regulator